jgi:hypothetical protein
MYSLVGRVHNCSRIAAHRDELANAMANLAQPMANETYKYRNAEKRRAYMREYMRKKRDGRRQDR